MSEALAWVVIFVLLFGCEMKVEYEVDGQPHTVVVNPSAKSKP